VDSAQEPQTRRGSLRYLLLQIRNDNIVSQTWHNGAMSTPTAQEGASVRSLPLAE